MAGTTTSFAEEKLFSGDGVAGQTALCRYGIQRANESRESFEVLSRKIKRGHACFGNSGFDDVAQVANGHLPHQGIPFQCRTLVRPVKIRSMATDAIFRI